MMTPSARFRVRIGGEVVAAAGPRATRKVAVPSDGPPRLLEFTRAWRFFEELPAPVLEDLRLEIETRAAASGNETQPPWRPLERPGGRIENEPPEPSPSGNPSTEDGIVAASYSQLKRVAKVLGLKAQGTKEELREAISVLIQSPDIEAEKRREALSMLEPEAAGPSESR